MTDKPTSGSSDNPQSSGQGTESGPAPSSDRAASERSGAVGKSSTTEVKVRAKWGKGIEGSYRKEEVNVSAVRSAKAVEFTHTPSESVTFTQSSTPRLTRDHRGTHRDK